MALKRERAKARYYKLKELEKTELNDKIEETPKQNNPVGRPRKY